MAPCNYLPLDAHYLDDSFPYFDDLLDLDVLCTEEGIFINVPTEQ